LLRQSRRCAGNSAFAAGQAQRFLSAHDQINNLFHLRRDHVTADQYRATRTQAFQSWAEITGVATLA
jgi:putative transposase